MMDTDIKVRMLRNAYKHAQETIKDFEEHDYPMCGDAYQTITDANKIVDYYSWLVDDKKEPPIIIKEFFK